MLTSNANSRKMFKISFAKTRNEPLKQQFNDYARKWQLATVN